MKTVFSTVVTGSYFEYAKVMLYSLRHVSGIGGAEHVLHVFHDDSLTFWMQDCLRTLYPWIRFKAIDVLKWAGYKKEHPAFWTLASFGLFFDQDVERVIYLDADLLFVKPVAGMATMGAGISMVWENIRKCFNAGMIIIDRSAVDLFTGEALMEIYPGPDDFGNDQWVINEHFKGRITKLPQSINAIMSELEFIKQGDVCVLHFTYKPDDPRYSMDIPAWCMELYNRAERRANPLGVRI